MRDHGSTAAHTSEEAYAHIAVGDHMAVVYPLDSAEGNQLTGSMTPRGRSALARWQDAWEGQNNGGFCVVASVMAALRYLGLHGSWTQERLWNEVLVPRGLVYRGVSFNGGAKLAHAVGLLTEVVSDYDEAVIEKELRADLRAAFLDDDQAGEDVCLLINYWRPSGGHWAPLAGWSQDYVLILDVAAFRITPHWVPISSLIHCLCRHNETTGKPRGYLTLRKRPKVAS